MRFRFGLFAGVSVVVLAVLLVSGLSGSGMPVASAAVGGVGVVVDDFDSKVVSCVPGRRYMHGRRGVLLTYDDGPSAQTPKLLDVLGRYKVSALFFVTGVQVSQFPGVVRRAVREGHVVGNHSISHSYNPYVIASELPRLQSKLRRLTGERVLYFRAPGLVRSSVVAGAVRRAGVCNLATDYDVGDWNLPRISSGEVCRRVVGSAHRGSIVLLHDGPDHVQTVRATSCILRGLKRKGLHVVSPGVSVGVPRVKG